MCFHQNFFICFYLVSYSYYNAGVKEILFRDYRWGFVVCFFVCCCFVLFFVLNIFHRNYGCNTDHITVLIYGDFCQILLYIKLTKSDFVLMALRSKIYRDACFLFSFVSCLSAYLGGWVYGCGWMDGWVDRLMAGPSWTDFSDCEWTVSF